MRLEAINNNKRQEPSKWRKSHLLLGSGRKLWNWLKAALLVPLEYMEMWPEFTGRWSSSILNSTVERENDVWPRKGNGTSLLEQNILDCQMEDLLSYRSMGRKGVTWLETPKRSSKRSFSLRAMKKKEYAGLEFQQLPGLWQCLTSLWFLVQRSAWPQHV